MILYVSKVFTATSVGECLKQVTCEKCGTPFYYELSRLGVGRGTAPYMMGQASAQNRAQIAAHQNLTQRLKQDQELVPCPSCRWVNTSAIKQYRKTRQRQWLSLAIFIAAIGLVTDIVLYFCAQDIFRKEPSLFNIEMVLFTVIWVLLVGLIFFVQHLLRRRINPNRWKNDKPNIPPGTPPAMLQRGTTEDGQITFDVIASEEMVNQIDSKWVLLRANQFTLPPLCCRCLDTATTGYKMPMAFNEAPIPVPLCQPCLGRYRWIWWLCNIVSPLLTLSIGWFVAGLPRGIDEVGRSFMMILIGGFLAVIGFAVIDTLLPPYRHRNVDADRGISRVKFRNPAYTALLLQRSREQDGLVPVVSQTSHEG